MKLLIPLLFAFSSMTFADFAAPPGTYKGPGKIVRLIDGTSVTYNASYKIADGALTATYADVTGAVSTLAFALVPASSGQFSVMLGHDPAGTGFCIDRSCQFDLKFPINGQQQDVSMTFTYAPNCESQLAIVSGKNATAGTVFEDIVKR